MRCTCYTPSCFAYWIQIKNTVFHQRRHIGKCECKFSLHLLVRLCMNLHFNDNNSLFTIEYQLRIPYYVRHNSLHSRLSLVSSIYILASSLSFQHIYSYIYAVPLLMCFTVSLPGIRKMRVLFKLDHPVGQCTREPESLGPIGELCLQHTNTHIPPVVILEISGLFHVDNLPVPILTVECDADGQRCIFLYNKNQKIL